MIQVSWLRYPGAKPPKPALSLVLWQCKSSKFVEFIRSIATKLWKKTEFLYSTFQSICKPSLRTTWTLQMESSLLGFSMFLFQRCTLPKSNIAPEHTPSPKGNQYSNHPFSGAMLVHKSSGSCSLSIILRGTNPASIAPVQSESRERSWRNLEPNYRQTCRHAGLWNFLSSSPPFNLMKKWVFKLKVIKQVLYNLLKQYFKFLLSKSNQYVWKHLMVW